MTPYATLILPSLEDVNALLAEEHTWRVVFVEQWTAVLKGLGFSKVKQQDGGLSAFQRVSDTMPDDMPERRFSAGVRPWEWAVTLDVEGGVDPTFGKGTHRHSIIEGETSPLPSRVAAALATFGFPIVEEPPEDIVTPPPAPREMTETIQMMLAEAFQKTYGGIVRENTRHGRTARWFIGTGTSVEVQVTTSNEDKSFNTEDPPAHIEHIEVSVQDFSYGKKTASYSGPYNVPMITCLIDSVMADVPVADLPGRLSMGLETYWQRAQDQHRGGAVGRTEDFHLDWWDLKAFLEAVGIPEEACHLMVPSLIESGQLVHIKAPEPTIEATTLIDPIFDDTEVDGTPDYRRDTFVVRLTGRLNF